VIIGFSYRCKVDILAVLCRLIEWERVMTSAVLPEQARPVIVLAIMGLGILTPHRGTQAGATLGTSANPLQPGLRPKENLLGLRLRGGTSLASEHIVRTTLVYSAPRGATVNVIGSWYADSALLDGMLNVLQRSHTWSYHT